jgi:Saxitoxin biosynthesis operon protein SxtJ
MVRPSATHERFDEDDDTVEASPRSFGFVFAAVFTLIGLAPLWRQGAVRWWSIVVALVLLAAALAMPRALQPLNRVWQRIGLLLHHVINPLVMGMLFYLAITPFGLVMRLFGRGLSAHLAPDSRVSTYWRSRIDSPPAGMRNQF